MAILRLFRDRGARAQAQRLHETVVQVSRQQAFFGEGRAPDTLQGRLEILIQHASLALLRLQAEPEAQPLAQQFTDILFRSLDAGLREAGVGDLTVPKKMRAIAERFYGRLNAYGAALREPDDASLTQALGRIIWRDEHHPHAPSLARYMRSLHIALQRCSLADLERPQSWGEAVLPDC